MRVIIRLLAVALLAFVIAACGETDDVADDAPAVDDPAEEADDPADETDEPDEPDEPADGMDAATVAVGSTDLGDVLVDDEGMTLYMFDPDEQGPSTCYEDCATNWPPLTVDGDPAAGEGVDEALLGTTERDDGSMQVTYDDWPLYHFAGDSASGETNGQGIQDVWWVIGPDGTPMRDASASDGGSPY